MMTVSSEGRFDTIMTCVTLKACHTLFLCSHIVVDIGFEHMVYNITEGDGFVDITFRVINMVRISSSSHPVEVQFEAIGGSATGK